LVERGNDQCNSYV